MFTTVSACVNLKTEGETNMLKPKFIIFVETVSGDIIRAFTWCQDAESGILRAKKEIKTIPAKIWAEPV